MKSETSQDETSPLSNWFFFIGIAWLEFFLILYIFLGFIIYSNLLTSKKPIDSIIVITVIDSECSEPSKQAHEEFLILKRKQILFSGKRVKEKR